MIVHIPNQPVAFNYPVNDCDTCDGRPDHCSPLALNEQLCFLIKQLPCGPNLICDGNFDQASFDLVSNGTFTGSAAGWTLGAGWTYGANLVSMNAAPGHGSLSQLISVPLIPGKQYRVKFTLSNVTGNVSLVPYVGALISSMGSSGPAATVAGIYQADIVAAAHGNYLRFANTLDTATFDIDSIELYEYSPCWEALGWDLTDGAVHIPLTTDILGQITPPLTSGTYYRVKYTVTDYTAGSFRARLGTNLGAVIDADGDYTEYITANGTGFAFVPTATFNGRITAVEVKALVNDYNLTFINLEDMVGTIISGAGTYIDDTVKFCINPTTYLPSGGCFKVQIQDQCEMYGDDLVPDPSFLNGSADYSFFSNWNVGFRQVFVPPADAQINAVFDGSGVQASGMAVSPLPGITKFAYAFKLSGPFPGDEIFYMQLNAAAQLVKSETTAGSFSGTVTTAPITSNFLTMFLHYPTGTEFSYLKDPSLIAITEIDITYISQCFKVGTFDCQRTIEGWCDRIAYGIDFPATGYKLKLNLQNVIVNPEYPADVSDYIYSDGTIRQQTAFLQKFWTFRCDFVPEWVHDALRTIIRCDHFTIDGVEYYAEKSDYTPEYLGGNDYLKLSTVSFKIRKKTELMQSNYCT